MNVGGEEHAHSAVRAYVPSKIRLFTSVPNPAVRVCAYTSAGERALESGGKGMCKPYWTPS